MPFRPQIHRRSLRMFGSSSTIRMLAINLPAAIFFVPGTGSCRCEEAYLKDEAAGRFHSSSESAGMLVDLFPAIAKPSPVPSAFAVKNGFKDMGMAFWSERAAPYLDPDDGASSMSSTSTATSFRNRFFKHQPHRANKSSRVVRMAFELLPRSGFIAVRDDFRKVRAAFKAWSVIDMMPSDDGNCVDSRRGKVEML